MELQPTLLSPHNLFTPAEGMKSTLSGGCKNCQLHIASSLCLFLSLSIAFSDTTIHSNSLFCIGLYVVVSAGCGDPPGNLHTSQEYSTFTFLLISFFTPFWKPLILTLNFSACSLALSVSSWLQKHSGGSVFIPWNASFLKRDKNRTSLVLLPQGLVLKGSWLLKEHGDIAGTKLPMQFNAKWIYC